MTEACRRTLLIIPMLASAQDPALLDLQNAIGLLKLVPLDEQHNDPATSMKSQQKAAASYWQPQVNLNAQATYQSDVAGIPLESRCSRIPTQQRPVPGYDRCYVKTLYDGGLVHQKTMSDPGSSSRICIREFTVPIPSYDQIDQLFTGILLARQQQLLIYSMKKDLREPQGTTGTAYKNGTATAAQVKKHWKQRSCGFKKVWMMPDPWNKPSGPWGN